MARIGKTLSDPEDKLAIVDIINQIVRVLDDANIEFGDPLSPLDDSSAVLAGAGTPTTHNGRLANIRGSWVEVEVTALDTAFTCTHNLEIPVSVSGEPNVRWLVAAMRHDGQAATGTGAPSILFEEGDTITTNSIELRLYCAAPRTINGTHPLHLSLFILPAVRWPSV